MSIPHDGKNAYVLVYGMGGRVPVFLEIRIPQIKPEEDEIGQYIPSKELNGLEKVLEEYANVGDRVYLV